MYCTSALQPLLEQNSEQKLITKLYAHASRESCPLQRDWVTKIGWPVDKTKPGVLLALGLVAPEMVPRWKPSLIEAQELCLAALDKQAIGQAEGEEL